MFAMRLMSAGLLLLMALIISFPFALNNCRALTSEEKDKAYTYTSILTALIFPFAISLMAAGAADRSPTIAEAIALPLHLMCFVAIATAGLTLMFWPPVLWLYRAFARRYRIAFPVQRR